MTSHRRPAAGMLLLCGLLATMAASAAPLDAADYLHDIKPVLKERCFACHGALKQEGGLRLDTGAAIRQGGDSGAAVHPGRVDESLLLERVAADDESLRMPPEGEPLTSEQIAALREWIAAGAPSPEGESPEKDPRSHWAFQPLRRPNVPDAPASSMSPNPIDAFLAQRRAAHGIPPQPAASKAIVLRRVSLDLIGLPPTPEELQAFLADESPDAYARAVDRLLESPRYGERWARHWMDVWRYSDWYGRRHVPDVWNSASQIWRWRDWIVNSLNADHGYDRMVREMLAADEIAPEDDEAGYATGYLVRNWYALNPNDWMRNTVEHTGKAFLGLTFNCAHCHDHKYDPIAQDDYFRFRAFFEPIYVRQDRVPGEADPGPFQDYDYGKLRKILRVGAVRIFDQNPEAPTWFYTGGDERNRVKERGSIPPGVPEFLSGWLTEIEPVELPPRAWYPGLRPGIQQTVLADAQAAVNAAETALAEAVAAAESAEVADDVRERLSRAEAAYEQARAAAEAGGTSGALVGSQSLLLDASAGRRVLQNGVQQLTSLPDGTVVEFQLQILADAHVNFQFARDVQQGLTAGYIGFDQGRIVAYQPGTFSEFEAGRYDFAGGQQRFQVRLVLETAADRCLLTVRCLTDDSVLVDNVPVALNGWNPIGDALKAISFDARTGSRALVDEIVFHCPATADAPAAPLLRFDFEAPRCPTGSDIVGIDGWMASSFGVAPATSVVSATAGNVELESARQELEAARRPLRLPELRKEAAAARQDAALAELAAVEARIAADRAQYEDDACGDAQELIRTASVRERATAVAKAEADVLAQEVAVAAAEARPADDKERGKALTTAQQALGAAQTARRKAQAALDDDSQAESYTPFSPTYPRTSTGRRTALAHWITNRQNPLTARVAVNHIWMRHFHVPLVESVYDFGLNGSPPSHPELLDWLAVEFMESGWSMKHLHRLIVTSASYRRSSSTLNAEKWLAADPENRLLWRMNTGRMEVEVLRDSLLWCGGKLDLTMGGQELENSESLTTFRRSLYYSTHPENQGKSPLGELFDGPDALECYRRTRSVVPQQALALTNSELVHQMSQAIAAEVPAENAGTAADDPGQFVDAAFIRILSRAPTAQERALCLDLYRQQVAQSPENDAATAAARGRESLVRALFNHNDFVTIR